MRPFKLLIIIALTAPFFISCGSDKQNTQIKKNLDKPSVEHIDAKTTELDHNLNANKKEAEKEVSDADTTTKNASTQLASTDEQPQNESGIKKETVKEEPTKKPVSKQTTPEKTPEVKPAVVTKPQKQVKTIVKPKKKPAIVFKELQYDFGEIYEGDEIKHEFIFKNTGNAPLEILSTDVTCGCTFPSYPFIAIEPGQTGHIGVSFKSVGKFGKQNPKISVKTNASSTPIALYLNGFVKKKDKPEEKELVNPIKTVKAQNEDSLSPIKEASDSVINKTPNEGKEIIQEVMDTTKKGS